MMLRYLNGEAIYVEKKYPLETGNDVIKRDGVLQVCRERDIRQAIEKLFRQAHLTPENTADIFILVSQMNIQFQHRVNVPIGVIKEEDAEFDDPSEIRNKQLEDDLDAFEELSAIAGVLDMTHLLMSEAELDFHNGLVQNTDEMVILLRQMSDRAKKLRDSLS